MADELHETGHFEAPYGEEFVVERPAGAIHLWRAGRGAGPPIVLTHGACLDHRQFEPQVAALARRRQVVTWDVRGHGASVPMGSTPFSITSAANDLQAILDALEIDQAIVGGHSMGGNIAQELVRHRPSRARALIVLDSAWNTAPRTGRDRFEMAVAKPSLLAWPYGRLKKSSVRGCAHSPAARAYARTAFDAMAKSDFVDVTVATTEILQPDPTYRVPVPLLLLVGRVDRQGSIMRDFKQWAAAEPDATAAVVPTASHLSNLDNPEFVNQAIVDFLATHRL